MRPKQTTKENTLLGKLGAEEKVPPPPSFLHLALHDVIQAALATPLWDQTDKLQLEFYSVNYFEIFFSYFRVSGISFLSIRVNYQTKPMVQTEADKNNWTLLETN